MQKVFIYDENYPNTYDTLIKMIEEDGYKVINSCYTGRNRVIYILEKPQRPKKKEKKEEPKHKYGQYKHVLLTDKQYDKLLEDFGGYDLEKWIRKVDEYVQMNKKTYSDYNLVIRNWANREKKNKYKSKANLDMFEDISF